MISFRGLLSYGDTNLNSLQKLIGVLTTFILCLLWPSFSVSAQSEDCSFLVSPQDLNTFEDDGVTVIGHVREQPYVVLVTRNLQDNLSDIRACIPDAFLTSSRAGSYVHVASFDNYRDARTLADEISEALGIHMRVIHRNRLRP